MEGIDYMKNKQISILVAKTAEEFADGRMLFEAYAASLNFNLCFQGFTEELQTIDQQYKTPTGALIIAYDGNNAIAVVGVRKFDTDKAELKRMFTTPEYRGQKIGYFLLDKAINIATELGYKQLLLDTLPEMQAAIKLYHGFGFTESQAYRFNPFDEAIYMKLELTSS